MSARKAPSGTARGAGLSGEAPRPSRLRERPPFSVIVEGDLARRGVPDSVLSSSGTSKIRIPPPSGVRASG